MDNLRRVLLGLLLGCSSLAWAGPEEDYQEGLALFQGGETVSAMVPLKRAADGGVAAAQFLFGLMLFNATDDVGAAGYYKKSAEQNYPEGQFYYGVALMVGEGVPQNVKAGFGWVSKAAAQGLKAAENHMASLVIEPPIDKKSGKAVELMNSDEMMNWLRKADDNNYIPAVTELANAYRTGKYGLTQDVKLADQYLEKANKLQGVDGKKKRRR